MQRRDLLKLLPAAALAAPAAPWPLLIFGKHLQFRRPEELPALTAELGFEGLDLTIRPGGNLEPATIATTLPPIVRACERLHVALPMATTGIAGLDTPHALTVLQALADNGIRTYRWGDLKYTPGEPIEPQLESWKPRVAALAEANRRRGLTAIFHIHSGLQRPRAWDVHTLLRGFDPAHVAINYDVGHATIEGGHGGWINSFHLLGQRLRGVAVKDFLWKRQTNHEWKATWCPIGEGQVRLAEFFRLLRGARYSGPLQVHFEYPLGGADQGATQITIPEKQVFDAMRRDTSKLRALMKESAP
jgi:sugar phosphate isomerase/epimerase